MMRIKILLVLITIVNLNILLAQNNPIDSLERLVQKDNPSPNVLYNIGTLYAQQKDYGNARYYLEKALLLSPYHKEIQQNLAYVIANLDTDIIAVEPFFLSKWWQGFYRLLSPTIWAVLSLIGLILTLSYVYMLWFKNQNNKYLVIIGLMNTILSIGAGKSRYNEIFDSQDAIVMEKSTLLESPSSNAEMIINLNPGVKIQIMNDYGDWVEAKTLDYRSGWLDKKNIKKLSE